MEAAIVISLFALGLAGLMFFREYYVKQLTASRLARGTAIAYAMQGCPDAETPANWVGKDKLKFRVGNGAQDRDMARDAKSDHSFTPNSGGPEDKSRAGGLLDSIPGLGGDGKSVLNPITTLELSGSVRGDIKGDLLKPDRKLFNAEVRSRSFATCGERMHDGDILEVFDRAKGALGNLVSL